jgi:predicted amidohydrolase
LQVRPAGSGPAANALRGIEACREAAALGAHLILFPEMWSTGYDLTSPGWQARAVPRDGAYIAAFREAARELGVVIAVTYLEEWPLAPRNTVSIIDPRGEIALTYAKVHTCDFDLEAGLTPGDSFEVATVDTPAGPVRIGAMICFDREFPESARVLMLGGAELILVPNACDLEHHRLSQFNARAFENMTAMAMTNYPAPVQNGHSIVLDGMAFHEYEGSRDMRLLEAGEGEGIFIADLDLEALRKYRAREAMGNAYRKPRAYSALVDERIEPPFIRPDARR